MKQIILPSTILELLIVDSFMEENGLASPLLKRKLGPPIPKFPKKFEISPVPSY